MMSPDLASSSNSGPPNHLGLASVRKEGVSRQRSVRTERQREQFGRVLKGRAEDGGGVEVGQLSLRRDIECLTERLYRRQTKKASLERHSKRSETHSLAITARKSLLLKSSISSEWWLILACRITFLCLPSPG